MGWTYQCDPRVGRKELADYLLSPICLGQNHRVLKHALVGNHLWSAIERVREDETVHRYIALDLLASGRPEMGWGYKDLCESMGLCELDCPISFFELVPEPPNEYATAWRAQVTEHHRLRRAEHTHQRTLSGGETITLSDGEYRLDQRLGRKGWRVVRLSDLKPFRLPARQAAIALRKRLAERDIPPISPPAEAATKPLPQQTAFALSASADVGLAP